MSINVYNSGTTITSIFNFELLKFQMATLQWSLTLFAVYNHLITNAENKIGRPQLSVASTSCNHILNVYQGKYDTDVASLKDKFLASSWIIVSVSICVASTN